MFGRSKDKQASGPVVPLAGRKPIMAGNWKMNKTTAEAVRLVQDISFGYDMTWTEGVDVIICPPAIDLKSAGNVIEFDHLPFKLGAQNVYWEPDGAFTGEISCRMLQEVGCTYCIVGHSERRGMFGETDETVNRKVHALLDADLLPIICCGESLETRDAGETESFVVSQIRAAFAGVPQEKVPQMVVAYEPVWAIGTGRAATPEAAEEVCGRIRATIADLYDRETADALRILYGGSMKPANVNQFMPMPDIDGGLIGGASLDAKSFIDLIKACLTWVDD